jgi:HEPN domain-containing protein
MTTPDEIRQLAWQRLEEAKILASNNMCDGAFYLSGYSVELMLKAKICERLGIPNLFDESDKNVNIIEGIGEIRKAVKTHNLFTLLIFSGLKVKLDER